MSDGRPPHRAAYPFPDCLLTEAAFGPILPASLLREAAMIDALSNVLRDAPFAVFVFAFGLPSLLSVAMAAAAVWARRNARALMALPGTTVDRLREGPALASGLVSGENALAAPLTGRRCVWYEAIVDESVGTTMGSGSDQEHNYSWRRRREETSRRPIDFAWNDAAARVRPDGATVFHSGWSEWYGPAAEPRGDAPDLHRGDVPMGGARFEVMTDPARRFRYRERYIFAGDPLFALGAATAPRAKGGAFGIAQAAGLPFLISTRSPGEVERDSGLAAKGGLVMAALFAALAVLVAYARFAA